MASRKEQKEKLRQERQERERAAAAAAARRRRMGYGVAGVLVVAVLAAIAVIAVAAGGGSSSSSSADPNSGSWPSGSVPKQQLTDLNAAAAAAGCKLLNPPSEGRGHTTGKVNYKTQPPSSGPHYPVPISDGAYLKAPPVTHIVHALEHGRVIYWFQPNAPASVRGDLHALYNEDKALVILLPDPEPMPYQVAASAWTHIIGCPTYNQKVPDALRAFRDAYRLKGPEYFPNAE